MRNEPTARPAARTEGESDLIRRFAHDAPAVGSKAYAVSAKARPINGKRLQDHPGMAWVIAYPPSTDIVMP